MAKIRTNSSKDYGAWSDENRYKATTEIKLDNGEKIKGEARGPSRQEAEKRSETAAEAEGASRNR
jgi:hypothetical protein